MTTEELTAQILKLPAAVRVEIARAIWESIEDDLVPVSGEFEVEAVATSKRRDAEISQGIVKDRPHEDVMKDVQRSLECK